MLEVMQQVIRDTRRIVAFEGRPLVDFTEYSFLAGLTVHDFEVEYAGPHTEGGNGSGPFPPPDDDGDLGVAV